MPRDFDTGQTSRFKSPDFSDVADGERVDVDSTSKLRSLSGDSIDLDLDRLASALGSGDTVEQPRAEDEVFSTEVFEASQRNRRVDLDVGEALNGLEPPTNKMQAISPTDKLAALSATDKMRAISPTTRTEKIKADDIPPVELEPVTMSEVGTKLDLARAYMDMGDPEGARSILEEVVQEGSASQKQEAQRLIETSARLAWRTLEDEPKVRRVAAIVEYDGTEYAGWQSQEHSVSIQDAVQAAISFVAGHPSGHHLRRPHRQRRARHRPGHPFRHHCRAHAARLGVGRQHPALPGDRAAVGRRGDDGLSRAAYGHAPHLPLLHFEPQRALGAAALACRLDASAARCRGHARGRAGADRRARFFRVSLGGVPVEDPGQARAAHRRAARGGLSVAGDRGKRLPASHGAQHRGNSGRRAGRAGSAAAMARVLEQGERRFAGATAPAAGLYLWRVEYPAIYGIPAPAI
jgi:FimV-like protein